MRIVVGNLSAVYTGRGDTELAPYNRIVIYKSDGTVAIHGDKGFKPLNYMTNTKDFQETLSEDQEKMWILSTKKETLTITFHEIFSEINLELGADDPGHSSRSGTEDELQEWLSKNIHVIDPSLRFVQREYQTGNGPVDILAEDAEGTLHIIEVKRFSTVNTVGQVKRYLDAMAETHPGSKVVGYIASPDIKERTWEYAEKAAIRCITVPSTWRESSEANPLEQEIEKVLGLF